MCQNPFYPIPAILEFLKDFPISSRPVGRVVGVVEIFSIGSFLEKISKIRAHTKFQKKKKRGTYIRHPPLKNYSQKRNTWSISATSGRVQQYAAQHPQLYLFDIGSLFPYGEICCHRANSNTNSEKRLIVGEGPKFGEIIQLRDPVFPNLLGNEVRQSGIAE